jgi:hypothetical protein
VISHAGGTVPYLAGRFGIVDAMDVIPGAADRTSAADTFGRLYWDTALSWTDPVLRHDMAVDCRQQIEHSEELTDAERRAVLNGTALKLIPRLAALRGRAES